MITYTPCNIRSWILLTYLLILHLLYRRQTTLYRRDLLLRLKEDYSLKNHIEEVPHFFTKVWNENVHDNAACVCVLWLFFYLFFFNSSLLRFFSLCSLWLYVTVICELLEVASSYSMQQNRHFLIQISKYFCTVGFEGLTTTITGFFGLRSGYTEYDNNLPTEA